MRAHNASNFDLSIVWVTAVLQYACVCVLTRVYVCASIVGKGVAGRDWRQNTGNATTMMAVWIGRTGVYDNRKAIEKDASFLSLSLSFFNLFGSSSFLFPVCVSSSTLPEHVGLESLLETPPLVNACVCFNAPLHSNPIGY